MGKSILAALIIIAVISALAYGLFRVLRQNRFGNLNLPITPKASIVPQGMSVSESTESSGQASQEKISPTPTPVGGESGGSTQSQTAATASSPPSPTPTVTPAPQNKSKSSYSKPTVTPALPTPTPFVFKVTQLTIAASPAAYSGSCPRDITFYGTITTNGSGEVKYRWIRSDGTETGESTLGFDFASSKSVENSWSRNGGNGWEKLKIVSPNTLESSQALFSISCS